MPAAVPHHIAEVQPTAAEQNQAVLMEATGRFREVRNKNNRERGKED